MCLPGPAVTAGYGDRMSTVTRPRGPLPARVYWTRRAVVLGVAFVLVLTIAKVLGSGSDASSEDGGDTAAAVSGERSSSQSTGTPTARPQPGRKARKQRVLAQPDGPCNPADIVIEPLIRREPGGGDVPIRLALSGREPACSWSATEDSVVIKITSGSDDIWSSQQCPNLDGREVVVRRAVRTVLTMTWNGRRSDEQCSRSAGWADPGWYHVVAAALGGEPTDVQFELTRPPAVRVTVTPKPKQKPAKASPAPSGRRTHSDDRPDDQSDEPSGAVEPDQTRG